jgi:hypothetical protein
MMNSGPSTWMRAERSGTTLAGCWVGERPRIDADSADFGAFSDEVLHAELPFGRLTVLREGLFILAFADALDTAALRGGVSV